MIEQPPLLTVRRTFPRPSPQQIAALTGAQTGHVADAFGGRAALSHRIKPIDAGNAAFCGVALTCHAGPGDIMATIAAYEIAEPGDVLVVATDACMTVAAAGDILIGMAKNRGAAAFVTDGCVRDIAGIRAFGLPCFAAGVTPDSPNCAGPGAVGFPVNMGGREIASGDVMIGDADGVVVDSVRPDRRGDRRRREGPRGRGGRDRPRRGRSRPAGFPRPSHRRRPDPLDRLTDFRSRETFDKPPADRRSRRRARGRASQSRGGFALRVLRSRRTRPCRRPDGNLGRDGPPRLVPGPRAVQVAPAARPAEFRMPVAVLIVALALYVYALVAAPRFRIPGAIAGALIVAGLGWYFFASSSWTERASQIVSVEDLALDRLELERTIRGATLRGRVENRAETAHLREMTITVRLFDCELEDTALDECATIGQSDAIARVDVPPGQLRGFSAHYIFPNLPALAGVLRWDYRITALRAT